MAELEGKEGRGWSAATAKMLNRTLPFDAHRAILLVREGKKTGHATSESPWDDEESSSSLPETLSGAEAKRFYEDVLSSMPEQSATSKGMVGRKRKRSSRRRTFQAGGDATKTEHANVTISQVFCFAQDGSLDGVRSAISNGSCDINATDHFHWTLLMSAAHAGHVHLVEYLLACGAKWREFVDKRRQNAADLARVAGHLSIACFIETYDDTVVERDESRRDVGGQKSDFDLRLNYPHRQLKTSTFYCNVCKQNIRVTEHSTERHTTSTVHQFSCQHKPNVPSYAIPLTNRGYQMMLREGWDPDKGLGPCQEGQKYPVKTVLKQDRLGLGQTPQETSQGKARVTHFAAFDERAVKRRSERFEKAPSERKKRDIVRAAHKDREWEIRMRRYMNAEHGYSSFS